MLFRIRTVCIMKEGLIMNVIELEYRVERSTQYGDYIAVVKVDKHSRKQTIELYDGDPSPGLLATLFGLEREPIDIKTVGPFTDVEKTIEKMIVEYELPYFQKERVQSNEHYLSIKYEEELKKRKPKIKESTDEVEKRHDILVNDYDEGTYVIDPDGKKYVITTNGKAVNVNSFANLKQYRK